MVDVIKTLDIKYLPSNCASSFRGIHESLINYGDNKMPEFLTCTHEESAVGMAHGYFKITGKPLMTLCHGTVGLQHAAMAVYNAWCDRVPVIIMGGNDLDAAHRPPGVPTVHSAQDINALVRDFTKWDDTPVSLQHFAQSFVRAYKISMTPPYGPVMISLDAGLQQEPIKAHNGEKLYIPKYTPTSPPQGETGAVKEAARLLANAERPVIVVDRAARTENGVRLLVQLAEALQARVVDMGAPHELPEDAPSQRRPAGGRQCRRHHRHGADRFLGRGERLCRQRRSRHRLQPDQDQARHQADQHQLGRTQHQVELSGLPALPGGRHCDGGGRGSDAAVADRGGEGRDPERPQGRDREARRGCEEGQGRSARAQPAGRGDRLGCKPDQHRAACRWRSGAQIKDLDWSIVAQSGNVSNWPLRLWPMEKHYHWLGRSGGYGVGYGAAGAVGGALANRDIGGRFSVSIQGDGDLMYAPGVLWTAAKHKIPLLSVMHNNRGYHQELMHVQRLSSFRNRVASLGGDIGPIGTSIMNPDIEYHKLAESMGWWAKGPIKDPAELGPAIKEAVAVVKSGQPALLNVWTQPR